MTATAASTSRDALDDKVNQIFAGKCVRKDLVRAVKVGANVPVFVLEYLLGKYCASSDPAAIELGLTVVRDTLANNYIRPDEATKAQSKVKQKGRYTFIDKVKVRLVGNTYVAECVNFGSNSLRISDDDVHAFERLLTGGVWAQVEVEWDESDSKAPFSISQLTPIQLASFNLAQYRKLRTQFSTEEWIDLLIRSMGYEPSQFSLRLKYLFLLRLIPLCERNLAAFSAIRRASARAGMLVMGDMSIQGNIKAARSLVEPLQVAMDNGARCALIPGENKRSFLEINTDEIDKIDPIFYNDVKTATFKGLDLN